MTAADLDAGKKFGRYLDVDDDGITYRTYPGTHPSKGAFFTRGTSKDRMARYSEEGPDYQENMDRLLKKHRTARKFIPPAILTKASEPTRLGAIYFGSTSAPMTEADEILTQQQGVALDLLRLRGFPFGAEVAVNAKMRRLGLLLSLASRYGAALNICRPLITSTSIASVHIQCVTRAAMEWR